MLPFLCPSLFSTPCYSPHYCLQGMSYLELAGILRHRAEEIQRVGLRKLRLVLSRSDQANLYEYLEAAVNPSYRFGDRYPYRSPTPEKGPAPAAPSTKRAASSTQSSAPKVRRVVTVPVESGVGEEVSAGESSEGEMDAPPATPAVVAATAAAPSPQLAPLPCPRSARHHHGLAKKERPDRFTTDRSGGKLYSCPFKDPTTGALCLVGTKSPSPYNTNRETVINHIRSVHLHHIPACTICGLTVELVSNLLTHYRNKHPLEEAESAE